MNALFLIAALLAPPVDWANRDYGFFTLKNGAAEMREYLELGGLHDTHTWKLKEARAVTLGARALTLVLIETSDYGAQGGSREAILFLLFDGGTELGRGSVPTHQATVRVDTTELVTAWAVGPERFEERWHLKDGKLVIKPR